ncbi:MAG: radical SAM protein, partial [Candidatus Rokubacteria bacterium]|nr:radical SAM protein [Candidatus Rokubacteria bacterium]
MSYKAYSVSWNLTQRCNLFCAHCYMSAFAGADASEELTTTECRRVMDELARVNPHMFLILTGGEPLLRPDLFQLADYAGQKGFTVVLGTNGVLLREKQAKLMREHGIRGASISLDSTDREKHDQFRHLAGAWESAVRATRALRAEELDFAIHMTVTDWNVEEIPAMIELASELGAKVLNLFFLVRTGRGQTLTDITPE